MTEENNYPPYYKIINKSEVIKKKDILNLFAIDKRNISIICEFNHEYPPNTRKIIGPIDINDWTRFIDKVVKKKLAAPPIVIKNEHTELIQGNLDQEYDNIVNEVLAIKNKNKNKNTSISDLSDLSDQTKNNYDNEKSKNNNLNQQLDIIGENEQQEQNNIPVLGVLEAITRLDEGPAKVIGRIASRTINSRVITRSEWKCLNPECNNRGILNFYPPIRFMPESLDTTRGTSPSCSVCKNFGSLEVNHNYQNSKRIQLDDIDTVEEKFDRLNVIMYGDASKTIIDGEIVEVEGNLFTQKVSLTGGNTNLVNVLHSDKPIIYKNRKENKLTQKDVDIYYRWKKICIDVYKKETELFNKCKRCAETIIPMTFEQRVTLLFAPNVYGNSDPKMGVLRSLIGGSKKENGAENGRRGRIHTGLFGDPGTTKTLLGTESTKLDQNSRMVDAAGASGKSLVGMVDKENDGLIVRYGVVVAAKNSHVVINESSSLSYDDQGHLTGIAEEGKSSLDKYSQHIPIDAPTTLILTTNPIGTKWKSNKMTKEEMSVIKPNLLDRIDQKYGFFDYQTESELEQFVKEVTKIKNRKPHNYNFLSKYLQYVKTIEPEWVGNAERRLNKFWIKIKLQDLEHNRSFFSIKRIAEAQAKLNLCWKVDDFIANKTMQSLQLMFMQYGKIIEQIRNPRYLTIETIYDILKENNGIGYTTSELCRIASDKNKQIKEYLNNRWDFENNKELRTIIGILEQKTGIIITKFRPKVLQYSIETSENNNHNSVTDQSDQSDQYLDSQIENNKNFQNHDQVDLEERAERTERSDSIDKLVEISSKSPPIGMTKERYESWFGKQNEKETDTN